MSFQPILRRLAIASLTAGLVAGLTTAPWPSTATSPPGPTGLRAAAAAGIATPHVPGPSDAGGSLDPLG